MHYSLHNAVDLCKTIVTVRDSGNTESEEEENALQHCLLYMLQFIIPWHMKVSPTRQKIPGPYITFLQGGQPGGKLSNILWDCWVSGSLGLHAAGAGYKIQLTSSRLSGDEHLLPLTDEHLLLHNIAWSFFHFNRPRLVTVGFMHQKIQSNQTWLLHVLHVSDVKRHIVDVAMISVPWHHMWKGTILSPSLLFLLSCVGMRL